jgi:hypothetical protein
MSVEVIKVVFDPKEKDMESFFVNSIMPMMYDLDEAYALTVYSPKTYRRGETLFSLDNLNKVITSRELMVYIRDVEI